MGLFHPYHFIYAQDQKSVLDNGYFVIGVCTDECFLWGCFYPNQGCLADHLR